MTIAIRYSEQHGRVGGHFRGSFHKARAARVARLAFNRWNESTGTCNCAVGPRLNIALVDRPVPPDGAFAHLDANVKSCRAFGDLQVAGNFLVRKQSEQKLQHLAFTRGQQLARQALSVTTKRWRIIALSWWYRYVRFFCGTGFLSLTFHRGGITIRATRIG